MRYICLSDIAFGAIVRFACCVFTGHREPGHTGAAW